MSWTTPRTWVSGEMVTAALMNLHVRDNLNYLYTQAFTNAVNPGSHDFGGSAVQPTSQVGSYLTGATYDKLAPNTDIHFIGSTLPDGLYVFEAVLFANDGGVAHLGIFDLGVTPNAPNLELVNSSPAAAATGEFLRSGSFSFTNTNKQYGTKLYGTVSAAWAWAIRFTRVG